MDIASITSGDFPVPSIFFSLFFAYTFYYFIFVAKKPVLTGNNKFTCFLLDRMALTQEKFWPTFWCIFPIPQTIISILIQSKPKVSYKREILNLSDGGQVALDYSTDYSENFESMPTVIVMPGLVGTSKENYVVNLIDECNKQGYRSLVFNYRGNGGVDLKNSQTYCATSTDDIGQVIDHVTTKYPSSPLFSIGISLGGIILTNYLAKRGHKSGLMSAMTVSVAWDFFESAKSLETYSNYIFFNRHLCQSLKANVLRHANLFKDCVDIGHVLKSKTIREFDDRFTCKVFGYRDWQHYYAEASIHNKVKLIKTPLLCLNACDDPFSPEAHFPLEEIEKSSHVVILMTSKGGHIAFMEGAMPKNFSYMKLVFAEFSRAMFDYGPELKL